MKQTLRNGSIQSYTANWTTNISSCTVDQQTVGLDYFYTVLVRDAQRNVQNYKTFQYSTNFLPTILLMEILTIKVEMADILLQKIMIALLSAPSFDKIVLVKIMLQ